MSSINSRRSPESPRASSVGKTLAALGVASLLLCAAFSAYAQSQSCPVTFRVTNATDPLSALQFGVNFGAAPAGGIDAASCTPDFPSDGVTDANVDNLAETISFAWADSSPPLFPAGPGNFATCDFIATTASLPLTAHFNPVTVVDASEGSPIPTTAVPFPTMSATVGACAPASPVCGNEVVESGEACDAGGETAACDDDCTAPACGDGSVNEADGEECDDGNAADGDGCGAACQLECGDGDLDLGEQCDDGNDVDGDGCSSRCTHTADCPATPRASCVGGAAGKNQLKLKDDVKATASNVKDNGQYKLMKATAEIADGLIGDPVTGTTVYKWCLYDGAGLLAGVEVAPDPTLWKCKTTPGKQSCKYKNADVVANGVFGVSVKAGPAGKGAASITLKSKAGHFAAPKMALVEPVESQLLVDTGSVLCFGTEFPAAKKNDGLKGQYQAKH